ncbi:protein RepA, partial [Escherichia coli]|nr:protein RepA [Escherichia coli]
MDKSFISDILYADIESKAKELTVNSNNTVQPVALMRLGVFVPKPTKKQ